MHTQLQGARVRMAVNFDCAILAVAHDDCLFVIIRLDCDALSTSFECENTLAGIKIGRFASREFIKDNLSISLLHSDLLAR